MTRRLVALIVLVALGVVAVCLAIWFRGQALPPIRVGILHSKTGSMKISEASMIEAEVMAIEEINQHGGLLGGREVRYDIADGRSDWPTFAHEAQRLIEEKEVKVIFGCWTSASRKSVLPVVEQNQHLLVYPMAYEGLEAVSQYLLHRSRTEPAGHSRLELVLPALEGPKVLPDRLRLRMASLRQRNRKGSAQGSGCRVRR